MKYIKKELDIQIRFADVDILGHVNNVNLQHYFDLGKNTYFRDVMHTGLIWRELGIITAATDTSYLAQTRLTDNIYVETAVEKIGTKSITVFQRILSRDTEEVRAESRSVMVAFDFERQVSIPVPEKWKKALEEAGTTK